MPTVIEAKPHGGRWAATGPSADSGWFFSLKGVLLVIVSYCSAHFITRLFASLNLGEDDPHENILIQVLKFAYEPLQPPLYSWVLWGVQQIVGPNIVSFLIIKYVLLITIACLLFVIARRVLGDPLWAFMCVETIGLIYQTTWRLHEGFTHAMGTIAAVLAGFWAFLKLLESPNGRSFAFFGLVAGFGMLTQSKFIFFLMAIFVAGLFQSSIRALFYEHRWKLVSALVLAAVISGPFYIWAFVWNDALSELMRPLANQENFTHGQKVVIGLKDAVIKPAACLLPLIIILVVVFPGMAPATLRLSRRPSGPGPDLVLLVGHYVLLILGGLVVGALIFGLNKYPAHRLIPLLLVAVVWLVHLARLGCQSRKQIRLFAAVVGVFLIVTFVGRMLNMFALDPFCKICRWGIPYDTLAQTIQARGFENGTIMTAEHELAGNLRRFFPNDRIVSTYRPIFAPPATPDIAKGQTVLVWSERFQPWLAHDQAKPFLRKGELARPWTVYRAEMPWRHYWRETGYRKTTWFFMIMDGQTGTSE